MSVAQLTSVRSPLNIVAPAAVTSAMVPFLLGRLLAIPMSACSSGDLLAVEVDKVWEIVAASASTASIYADAYWDDTAKNITHVSSGNTRVGIFMRAKTNGQLVAHVLINV